MKKERGELQKITFEEILAKIFSNMTNTRNPEIQEALRNMKN